MVPLRYGVDDVQLGTVMTDGNEMEVFGRVPVVFDAGGFEFSMQCWVVNVGLPVELVLGLDWMDKFSPTVSFEAAGSGSPRRTRSESGISKTCMWRNRDALGLREYLTELDFFSNKMVDRIRSSVTIDDHYCAMTSLGGAESA
ncbi:hypothetical protein A0H81_03009 [Grifola frondosa]|uniref:Uncharacterized protein n=1 Tax=Grifola frondosa TaxID=5627 RepID=A0A1C7MH27_GRIFR|nr:hypothetical protein A0H81_03009 [Grifola frondosa]